MNKLLSDKQIIIILRSKYKWAYNRDPLTKNKRSLSRNIKVFGSFFLEDNSKKFLYSQN